LLLLKTVTSYYFPHSGSKRKKKKKLFHRFKSIFPLEKNENSQTQNRLACRRAMSGWIPTRVARWFIFKPKILIWVIFVGLWIGKC
jgi:hypothetical protein